MATNINTIPAAVVIPPNLSGKTLKVVTKDYGDGSGASFKPLKGKHYDDNTPVIEPMIDIIEALGGEYEELVDEENTAIGDIPGIGDIVGPGGTEGN